MPPLRIPLDHRAPGWHSLVGLAAICQKCHQHVPRQHPTPPAWVTEAADWLAEHSLSPLDNRREKRKRCKHLDTK